MADLKANEAHLCVKPDTAYFIHRTAKIIHRLGRHTEELDTISGRISTEMKGVAHRIIHS